MQQRSLQDEIKYQWKYGGVLIQLIGINLVTFLVIGILLVLGRLFSGNVEGFMSSIVYNVFTLHGNFQGVLIRPWGLITSIFAHFELFHFLFNMVFLYFVGKLFLTYFSASRLLYTYILGGLLGGIFQVIAYSIFPGLQGAPNYVVGASGSVMAIFMAVAFYRPMQEIHLFGIIRLKLIFLAGIFILLDLMRLGVQDNIAHFAHLGGIVFGIWSIQSLNTNKNIVTKIQRLIEQIKSRLKGKPVLKTQKGGNQKPYNTKSDDEYNAYKQAKQAEIDKILDKISKSGYDSLTKKEKQTLFDQSNN